MVDTVMVPRARARDRADPGRVRPPAARASWAWRSWRRRSSPRRLPPRPRGARARARARRAAPRARRPCRFSEDVRAELAEAAAGAAHCRLALLAGVVRHAGSFHLRGRAVEVHVDLALAARRRAARSSCCATRGATCEIRTYRERRFERATRFLIVVARRRALAAGAARGRRARPRASRRPSACRARIVARGCCRRAYLRGAFLGCGSLSRPRRPAHLEWRRLERRGRRCSCASSARGRGLRAGRARDAAALARLRQEPRDDPRPAGRARRARRRAAARGGGRVRVGARGGEPPGQRRRGQPAPAGRGRGRGTPTRSSSSAGPTRCRPSCASVRRAAARALPDATAGRAGRRGHRRG